MVVTFNPALTQTSFTSKKRGATAKAPYLGPLDTAPKKVKSYAPHSVRNLLHKGKVAWVGLITLLASCAPDLTEYYKSDSAGSQTGVVITDTVKTNPTDTLPKIEANIPINYRLGYEADSLELGTGKPIDSTAYVDGTDGLMKENKYKYINDSTAIIERVSYPPTKPSRKAKELIVSISNGLGLGHKDVSYTCDDNFQPINSSATLKYERLESKEKGLYHYVADGSHYATTLPDGKLTTVTQYVNSQTKLKNEYKCFIEQITTGLPTVTTNLPTNYKNAIQAANRVCKTAAKNVR